jgi:hypothetical protein
MKQYASMWLSVWHTYKNMMERIWKTWLGPVFGPVYHDLFPKDKLFYKPKLRLITTYFHMLMLAYGGQRGFRKELDDAITDDRTTINRRAILQNIKDLFEFFIPTV